MPNHANTGAQNSPVCRIKKKKKPQREIAKKMMQRHIAFFDKQNYFQPFSTKKKLNQVKKHANTKFLLEIHGNVCLVRIHFFQSTATVPCREKLEKAG